MIRALTLIVIGAASLAAVYFVVAPNEELTETPEAAAPLRVPGAPVEPTSTTVQDPAASVGFELRPGAEPATPVAEAPRTIRDVTPDTMTAGPRVTGTLTRAEPPAAPAKARMQRLFNPIVIAAGVLKVREREIRLAGIAAPEFARVCGKGATAWPCGRVARAALRSFIRGRAIECEIPAGADKIPDPAHCVVGGDDIAEWLVAQGWAKRSGDQFEAAEKKAQEAKLGLWGDGRPGAQVATSG